MNGTFSEQLGGLTGVFEQWGACERTVMACALARRVPWPGLKLVHSAVEAALRTHGEDEILEREANDETVLANLLVTRNDDDENESCERLRQLLGLLPLLRADNSRAAELYVCAAPALVQRCVDAPRRAAADLCRQMLSYLLVHPALTHRDHRSLTQWLRYLESHISGNRATESVWQQRIETPVPEPNIWGAANPFRRTIGKNVEFRGLLDTIANPPPNTELQESFSKNGRDVDISLDGEKLNFDAAIAQPKSQRSNSLTPPSTHFMHMSSSAENLSDEPFVQKPRSFSLSSEHSLGQLRPISVMYGTTGSETRLDDLRSNNFMEHPGMSTVAQWLKSLRLHKYVWLFSNISYNQMMAMDEEYLEKLGVTKGARHKLLLSIKKLKDRESALESIQTELSASSGAAGAATRALEKLRALLLTPMPPACDLPAGIVRALELAATSVGSATEEGDPVALHCWLIERALHHPSFSSAALQASLRALRHRLPPRQFYLHLTDLPRHHYKHRWRATAGPPRARRWPRPQPPPPPPPQRGKSNSYPPFPPSAIPRPPPPQSSSSLGDEYSSLDALCLQMTEQAIN